MSEKLGFIIARSSTFFSAITVAYTRSYVLASNIVSVIVATILNTGVSTIFIINYQVKSQDGYLGGSSVAEEVIGSAGNVQAFGIQDRMAAAYD